MPTEFIVVVLLIIVYTAAAIENMKFIDKNHERSLSQNIIFELHNEFSGFFTEESGFFD